MPVRSNRGVLPPSLGVVSVSSELCPPVIVLKAASMKEAPDDGRSVRLFPRIFGRGPVDPEPEPELATDSDSDKARALVFAVMVSFRLSPG